MMMTRILLIRHATTPAVGKSLTGRLPGIELNEEGRQQAKALAERLSHLSIDAVYCSPLERAVDTARPLASKLQLPLQTLNELNELDLGEWSGSELETLRSNRQFQRFNSFRSLAMVPGGETMLQAQSRMVQALQKLCQQHGNQTIALVSHSDIIKAAIAYLAGIHLDLFQRIEISPASVSIVEVFEETVRIVLLNHNGSISF